ncbi:MAG: hypothetical protein EA357_06560 [Micavibrio sp.]|nr:MAG: hypothetical protein EA357_06560 [Micavibrio sp.]
MVSTSISFLGKSKTQSAHLLRLRNTLNDLQRQIATQKKTDTMSGLGRDAVRAQNLRTDLKNMKSYVTNIERSTLKTKIMSETMTEISRVAQDMASGFLLETRSGEVDVDNLRSMAEHHLRYIKELLNTKLHDAHVFAGSDSLTAPFADLPGLNANIQAEFTDWLAGGQTPQQLLDNVDALTGTALGQSQSLGSAGQVIAKIDDGLEIDLTVKADHPAIEDIMRGLALAANMQFPDPAVDTATEEEFFVIFEAIIQKLGNAAHELNRENNKLVTNTILMENVKTRHQSDREIMLNVLNDIEDIDTAEAVIKLQALETQLIASFETTRLANQLSLVNFL